MPCFPCFKRKGKEKYTLGEYKETPSKTPPQQSQVSQPPETQREKTPSPEKTAPPVVTESQPVVEETVQKSETVAVEAAPPEPVQKTPEKEATPKAFVFAIPEIPEDLDNNAAFELALTTLARLYETAPEDLTPEMAQEMERLVSRLERVADRLEATTGGATSAASGGDAEYVSAYNDFLDTHITPFVALSKEVGGKVGEVSVKVEEGFKLVKALLVTASKHQKPSDSKLPAILKPLSVVITSVGDFKENHRKDAKFNHLSALSEGIPALGWVAVGPKPAPYVQMMEEAAQFYTNKVLKDFRESDPKQADWAKQWIKVLKGLQAYVKASHLTGLSWNKAGPPVVDGAPAPPSGSPAPPPPPPPAVLPPVVAPTPKAGASDTAKAALFGDLNKGGDVTKGLKKVSDDMKTHKNPALRLGPAPYKKPATAPKPASPKTAPITAAKKPPKLALEGKKWLVEHQENQQGLMITTAEPQHTVYVYKCSNSTLQVKGKVNSIILDTCKKVGLVFDNVISSVEFVNCQSMKAQVNGVCSIFNIDKTDGCQIFLNEKTMDAEIVTAKSSEMNICIVKEDGDLVEYPLPEQFKSKFDGKSFKTVTLDSL